MQEADSEAAPPAHLPGVTRLVNITGLVRGPAEPLLGPCTMKTGRVQTRCFRTPVVGELVTGNRKRHREDTEGMEERVSGKHRPCPCREAGDSKGRRAEEVDGPTSPAGATVREGPSRQGRGATPGQRWQGGPTGRATQQTPSSRTDRHFLSRSPETSQNANLIRPPRNTEENQCDERRQAPEQSPGKPRSQQ